MALSLHWRIERQSIKSANPCIGRALMSQYHTSGWYGGTPKSETMSKTMPQKINCIVNMNIMVQGGDGGTPKCIEKSKLCDGHKDCQDGADEKNACCKSSSSSYSLPSSSSSLYSSSSSFCPCPRPHPHSRPRPYCWQWQESSFLCFLSSRLALPRH